MAVDEGPLAPILAAVHRADEEGRFGTRDLGALRKAAAGLLEDGSFLDLHPEDVLGPWVDLPAGVRRHLRQWCEEEISGAMTYHPHGRFWPGLARGLHTVAGRWEEDEAPRRRALLERGAAALLRRPRMIWESWRRKQERKEWLGPHPRVSSLVTTLIKDPSWLMAGYSEGVRVDPRCRGFHHDPKRNVAWGQILGIDLVPTETGAVCHEANLNPGLTGNMRKGYWDRDPIPDGLVEMAAENGFRNVVWMNGVHQPIDAWFHSQLHSVLTQAGLGFTVLEDPQNPTRDDVPEGIPTPARAAFIPNHAEPDTFLLRLRDLRAGPDVLLGHKERFAQAVGRDLQRAGDDRVRVQPLTRVPPEITLPEDPGVPNLVYKYPLGGKGKDVYFLRARDQAHAIALGRELDERTGLKNGAFQPWVHSPVLPGRLIYEFRTLILVSPVGVRFLGARRRETVTPLPETLPEGIVEDRRPFIITGFFDNVTVPRDPNLEGPIEAASIGIAESAARLLRRGFVTEGR